MKEDGAILLIVLVALALMAALAGLVLRVSQSDLATLSGERAAFRRDVLLQSALATLGARLPSPDLAEDGTEVTIALPGGQVTARILPAAGLINPNFTREPGLVAALTALGASPGQANRLASAMVAKRGAANRRTFDAMAKVAALFAKDPELWPKIAPYVTLLGRAEVIDVTRAPTVLQQAATPPTAGQVDFSGAGRAGLRGFYEIWLNVAGGGDPQARLWTHVSALVGTDLRLHILMMAWPQRMGG